MGDIVYDNPTVLQHLIAQIKSFYQAGKLVSAICIGPVSLAKANILSGKQVTGWVDEQGTQKNEIESAGATFTGEPVTIDGNIITANGPSAATAFGEAIKNYFSKEDSNA